MDPQQQQQMASVMAGFGAAFLFFSLLVAALMVFLFWRVFSKAGMSGAMGLIALVPGFGWLICLCILAFSRWRVTPLPPGYETGLQGYPPPYPAEAYPPSRPPSQL